MNAVGRRRVAQRHLTLISRAVQDVQILKFASFFWGRVSGRGIDDKWAIPATVLACGRIEYYVRVQIIHPPLPRLVGAKQRIARTFLKPPEVQAHAFDGLN